MDLSPKTLREVEFREKLRGYHPEDVDQFLERIAAGIEALQDTLRQTTERAVHAEELAAATGETDDALRRTLILAQKTADAAIDEARTQAGQIVGTAEEQARAIVDEAKQEAVRIATEAQADLRRDIDALQEAKTRLQGDVGNLQTWIQSHRDTLSSALGEALRQVEEGVFVSAPAPTSDDVDVPAPVELEAEEAVDTDSDIEAEAVETSPFDHDGAPAQANAETAAIDDEEGPAPVIEHDENDPFMAELRRAVTDEEPLGPRDEDDEPAPVAASNEAAFYADDTDANRRFGSRRKRRR